VLSERALLNIPEVPAQLRQELQRQFGQLASFLEPAVAVDWSRVDEDVRQAALSLFFIHPLFSSQDSKMVLKNTSACEALLGFYSPLQEHWSSVRELMNFLHVVDLNIHRDDESSHNAGFTGIFVLGSKFSHSCSPNCSWSFSSKGRLQYRALLKIAPGELLTFSYIGNGMNLIMSAIERRRRLGSLWFVCACGRCAGPDLARQVRCPRCGACRCVPAYEDCGMPDWAGDRPLKDLIPDARTWRCAACGASVPAAELPLREEAEMAELVPEAMQGGPQRAPLDAATLAGLREGAARSLGTSHWTYVLATFAWLQKALIMLRGEPLIDFSEADLHDAMVHVARWFEHCIPNNVEQRISALFLALRHARNLGESLDVWGFDSAEPLGPDHSVIPRLEEHGWRIRGGPVAGPDDPR